MVSPVTPSLTTHESSPTEKDDIAIGIIGMGEMGRLYAERLMKGGWNKINVCDLPSKYDQLVEDYKGTNLRVMRDGHLVSRESDFIIYSVEAAFMDSIVKQFGPSTKYGAVVSGQTSVKAPERKAFEDYLPQDCHIISIHSLHGPTVAPDGQALILIQHRATDEKMRLVERILSPLKSRYVHLTYEEHDEVTANTQAVTHAAFLSMGTAWKSMGENPWETGRYVGGIEVVKINITLRIYAAKWHVYAGLAILNPAARVQIDQFARSVSDLFKLMVEGRESQLRERVLKAREFVFGGDKSLNETVLLSDKVLDKFTIGQPTLTESPPPNSHLSLLAMVDCWHELKIRPFVHLALAATPVFRLWIGVAEYLFRSEERLESAIQASIHKTLHRSDDIEFLVAARGWSQCVSYGDFELYKHRFEETAGFFESRFEESRATNKEMFKFLAEDPVQVQKVE